MSLQENTWIHQYLMLYATLKLREGVFQLPFYLYVIKYLSIYICVKKKQSLYICNLSSVGIVYSSYILIYRTVVLFVHISIKIFDCWNFRMLSKDPDKRPSATDLLKIPLIKNHIAVSFPEDFFCNP